MDENLPRDPGSDDNSGTPRQRTSPFSLVLKLLGVLGIVVIVAAIMLPATRSAREPARRNQCKNNLRQIAGALLNYAEVHGTLPPAYTTDADGKPLHSWRTLILPFMEEQKLYESIDLTKPWDDPANATAFKAKPDLYQCPSAPWEEDNRTPYLAVVTPNSCFRETEPRSLSEITDDASQTLMVIEADEEHAVPWMSPVDADEKVVLGLGGPESRLAHANGMHAAFADGHVGFLPDTMPAGQRRALISTAGNDKAAAAGEE